MNGARNCNLFSMCIDLNNYPNVIHWAMHMGGGGVRESWEGGVRESWGGGVRECVI